MTKLLLTGAYHYSDDQIKLLSDLGFQVSFIQDEREPLKIDVSEFKVVVCNSLFLHNDITGFKNLRFIQLTSAGFDRLPLDYVKKNNIRVENAKGVYGVPMAEWVILKILEIYKKSKLFYNSQEKHQWEKQRDILELTGKTVSIIGFGHVGSEVAKRLKAFGVKVMGVGRRKIKSEYLDDYYLIHDIDEVLKKSDVVVITLPYTNETHHLFSAPRLKNMKNKSVLINVSRGGIIDQEALISALQSKKFLGVALDVFEQEPLDIQNKLWSFEESIITPHNSFISDHTHNRMFEVILKNLKNNLSKEN